MLSAVDSYRCDGRIIVCTVEFFEPLRRAAKRAVAGANEPPTERPSAVAVVEAAGLGYLIRLAPGTDARDQKPAAMPSGGAVEAEIVVAEAAARLYRVWCDAECAAGLPEDAHGLAAVTAHAERVVRAGAAYRLAQRVGPTGRAAKIEAESAYLLRAFADAVAPSPVRLSTELAWLLAPCQPRYDLVFASPYRHVRTIIEVPPAIWRDTYGRVRI